MTVSCSNCGTLARTGAKFCSVCGTVLPILTQRLGANHVMRNGDYRIVRTLGKGGMGVVYLAENLQAFGRLCVIKEMLDYFDPNDPQQAANARKRFEDEARTLANLRHPGIPAIQAYFREGGHNYIVMEYVDGMSLEQAVTRKDNSGQMVPGQPLSVEQVVGYGLRLCEILVHLASLSPPVVHHDIKPANIIVDKRDDMARLVDFGTAKARLTVQPGGKIGLQKSSIYGTQGYAPPEQYKGQSEVRSDVYALAATLYHLLTDDDPSDHPFDFPQLKQLPLTLGQILGQALESKVTNRSTAAEMKQGLNALLTTITASQGVINPSLLDPNEPSSTVDNKEQVWRWSDHHWVAALTSLASGQMALCLHFIGEPQLEQEATRCRQMTDPNIGLETVLRACGAPPPSKWETNALDIEGNLGYGWLPKIGKKPNVVTFKILNQSTRGYLHGYLDPVAPWLSIPQPHFGCQPGQIAEIEIHADHKARSRKLFSFGERLFDIVIE